MMALKDFTWDWLLAKVTDSQTMCRDDIENVPKKFNSTMVMSNFSIFQKIDFKAEPMALVSTTTLPFSNKN